MPDQPPAPATSDAAPRPGDSFVQSFARGLSVIRSFSASAPRQTLTQVAQRAGLTRAGARRILLTLAQLGYVESQGRLFQLTPRILDLGFAYLSSLPLWDLAEPVMETLAAEARESCSAAVLDGPDIVYVMRVHTHKIMSINLGIGSRLPAWCTSMGRVLLAALDDAELQRRLALAPRNARTARTLTAEAELLAAITAVRQQGWCLVDQELEEGLVSLAAPILDRGGRTIAALNISGQANRTPAPLLIERHLPLLRSAAQQISQLLQMKA
ncbi:MAG: IclR family transcriptional regulator [Rubrivivax sp.]|nr:IclR family transcriptional regulator [Rubrivivax sp.]